MWLLYYLYLLVYVNMPFGVVCVLVSRRLGAEGWSVSYGSGVPDHILLFLNKSIALGLNGFCDKR